MVKDKATPAAKVVTEKFNRQRFLDEQLVSLSFDAARAAGLLNDKLVGVVKQLFAPNLEMRAARKEKIKIDPAREARLRKAMFGERVDPATIAATEEVDLTETQTLGKKQKSAIKKGTEILKDLSDSELKAVSDFVAGTSLIIEAGRLANASRTEPSARARIKAMYQRQFEKARGKDGKIDPEKLSRILDYTKDIVQEKFLYDQTFTYHPKMPMTDFARKWVKMFTGDMEAYFARGNAKEDGLLDTDKAESVKELMTRTFFGEVKAGKALTPNQKMTVAQEAKVAAEIIDDGVIAGIRNAVEDHNAVIAELMIENLDPKKQVVPTHLVTKLEDLVITPTRRDEMFKVATWVGRDWDGRPYATVMALAEDLSKITKTGEWKGPRGDDRQNSEVVEGVVSALIQRAYRGSAVNRSDNGAFAMRVEEYNRSTGINPHPDSDLAKRIIFTELTGEQKAEFLRYLILNKDENFFREKKVLGKTVFLELVPARLTDNTLMFVSKYPDIIAEFRREYSLPDTATFEDFASYKDEKTGENLKMVFRQRIETTVFGMVDDTPYHVRLEESGLGFTSRDTDSTSHMFSRTRVLDGDGDRVLLTDDVVRNTLIDHVKKLIVLNAYIDEYGAAKVGYRFEMANFEEKSDFYGMFLLMQHTGLIELDGKGKCTKAKMCIMPLVETLEDMKNAPKIFAELWDDPIIMSYYVQLLKEHGTIDLMHGYSDGSFTGGPFESETQNYFLQLELLELLRVKMEKYYVEQEKMGVDDAKVLVGETLVLLTKLGRGEDPNRGGLLIGEAEAQMLPVEVLVQPRRVAITETVQANGPEKSYLSAHQGRSRTAGCFSGMVDVAVDRMLVLEDPVKTKFEKDRLKSFELAMKHIGGVTSKVYMEKVRGDREALEFVNGFPNNANASSRPTKRGGGKKDKSPKTPERIVAEWDGTRAITKEDPLVKTQACVNDTGLAEGLTDYMGNKTAPKVIDRDGKEVSGLKALQVMYRDFPFFRNRLDRSQAVALVYNQNVAEIYGGALKTPDFIRNTGKSISGLSKTIDKISAVMGRSAANPDSTLASAELRKRYVDERPIAPTLAQVGDMLLLDAQRRNKGSMKPGDETSPPVRDTIFNAIMTQNWPRVAGTPVTPNITRGARV